MRLHLKRLAAQGAEVFVADTSDASGLSKAFEGADSAYVMIPPDMTSKDYRGFQGQVASAIAHAVQSAGVKNVVSLSSLGADKSSGNGPVAGLYELEEKLNQTSAENILHLRAGYFMENTIAQVGAIRMVGSAVGPVRPDLKLLMISARDIGAAAGDALSELSFRGKLASGAPWAQRDLDYNEVASIIGHAIGKPKLGYVHAPNDQLRTAMVQMGMSDNMAGLILELAKALNSGYMRALEPRTPANTTPTPFETFVAQSFTPAYQQQVAA